MTSRQPIQLSRRDRTADGQHPDERGDDEEADLYPVRARRRLDAAAALDVDDGVAVEELLKLGTGGDIKELAGGSEVDDLVVAYHLEAGAEK